MEVYANDKHNKRNGTNEVQIVQRRACPNIDINAHPEVQCEPNGLHPESDKPHLRIGQKLLLHILVRPESVNKPNDVEEKNHVDYYYSPDALSVPKTIAAHTLRGVKVVFSHELSFQVLQVPRLVAFYLYLNFLDSFLHLLRLQVTIFSCLLFLSNLSSFLGCSLLLSQNFRLTIFRGHFR